MNDAVPRPSDEAAASDGMSYDSIVLESQRPIPTGKLLVTLREGGASANRFSMLRDGSGGHVSAASVSDIAGQFTLPDGETVFLEEIGLAIVAPPQGSNIAAMMHAYGASDEVAEARPAYHLFATRLPFHDVAQQTWGIEAIGAHNSAYTGRGIKIAVLDTGLDPGHPDFAGRTIVARDFTRSAPDARDGQGHGTHCAGTAAGPLAFGERPRYGVAPEAELYVAKTLDDAGSGKEEDILAGLAWAIQNRCEVISMSLGRTVRPGERPTLVYERLGRYALASGCLVVAAAGNDSARASGYIAPVSEPANAPSFLAVAAVDQKLEVAYFSNGTVNPEGGEVDIAGPGANIFSSVPMPRGYRTLGGTSMACPHVAGVAALWAQSNPALRGQALWDALVANAMAIPGSKRDIGVGLVQVPPNPPVA